MQVAHFEHQSKKKKTIYGADLDLDRTKRIYKTLNRLSQEALSFLGKGDLKEFSFATDRMRPLMSYINDNKVLISKHLGLSDGEGESISDEDIKGFASQLTNNLKTISRVQETMNQVDFSQVFFMSNELTNAYLDNQIPLSWEFHNDLVVILNLENRRLIDLLIERGQKRIFLVNGSIDVQELAKNSSFPPGIVLHKTHDFMEIQDLILLFNDQPPRRFLALDCGVESTETKTMDEIRNSIERGREAAWLRFNTINRGDAVKILDNLNNIVESKQTSEFHKKFKNQSAIIVCPGPSLSKNIDQLKKAKGKILIIAVLHAFKALKMAGIVPDIVIHTDPFSLKELHFERDGEQISQWDEWIENNDFSEISYFITSSMGAPQMFNIPAKKVLWMSPGQRIGAYMPIDVFDYTRVGGSVSHSAFDLMIEFGFKSIALVGQDLAFAEDGGLYTEHADLETSETDALKKRINALGERFMVKGYNGKDAETNNSFYYFGQAYERFADQLIDLDIELFNCTEGGMYLDGFEHIPLKDFIDKKTSGVAEDIIDNTFAETEKNSQSVANSKKLMRQYVSKNRLLGNEIYELIKGATEIVEKGDYSNHRLAKFDKIQNKVIKSMKRNYFFELGLQKELYMLRSGLGADRSVEGQMAFHLDFLKAGQKFNNKFRRALKDQFEQLASN